MTAHQRLETTLPKLARQSLLPVPLHSYPHPHSMDAAQLRKLLEESQKTTLALVVCCLSVVVRVHIAFIIRRS